MDRIKSDFEFIVGHILSKMWLLLWTVIPLLLAAIFSWAFITLPLEGTNNQDPAWLYGIGYGIVLSASLFIFVIGYVIVRKQDGFTLKDVSIQVFIFMVQYHIFLMKYDSNFLYM